MEALHQSRDEMKKLIARMRVRISLSRNVPASADRDLISGYMCLIYEDFSINKSVGLYLAMATDCRAVTVILDGKSSSYSINKC